MAKRLRKLRIREVSLCRRGMNPEAEIVLHKAEAPEPRFPTTTETLKALQGATPEALEIVKQQIESHARLLEELKKLNNPEEPDMTDTDPNFHYNKLVREHAEKADMSFADAAVDLQKRRPDKVAAVYEQDQQTYIARQRAEAEKVYGGAA